MHFSPNPKISPYLSFGLGFSINDFDQNSQVTDFVFGSGTKVEVDDSFIYSVGAGVEFFISDNAAFNLDLKYIWMNIDGEVSWPSGIKDGNDYDIDPFVIGVGLKYY